jgi:DNA-binding PadR family transcriptional regulator
LLRGRGIERSNATFYQLAKQLEEQGLLRGWYRARLVGDFAIRERYYELTTDGRRAFETTRAYYRRSALELVS